MFVCGISIRAALALPITPRELDFSTHGIRPPTPRTMRAVNHLVTSYVVGFPVAASVPVLWLALGTASAITAAVIITLVGLVFVHGVLLDWRRIPFTCSFFQASASLLTLWFLALPPLRCSRHLARCWLPVDDQAVDQPGDCDHSFRQCMDAEAKAVRDVAGNAADLR